MLKGLDYAVQNICFLKKTEFLLSHHIALWDVIASCEIEGSADSSIKNVTANDLSPILNSANIRQIFVNGRTAQKLYQRFLQPVLGRGAEYLPSTSPANAACSLERLTEEWRRIENL